MSSAVVEATDSDSVQASDFKSNQATVNAALAEDFSRTVCLGPEWIFPYPETCFEIDTEFIGGMRLDQFHVSKPQVLAVNFSDRRDELQTFSAETINHYCSDFSAGSSTLPTITTDNIQAFLSSQQDVSLGVPTSAEFALVVLENVATSSGLQLPEVSFQFRVYPEASDIEFKFDRSFLEPGQYPQFDENLYFLMDIDGGVRIFPHKSEPRYAFNTLPNELRELILGIMYQMPSIFGQGIEINIPPDASIVALADQSGFISHATTFKQAAFDPVFIPPVLTLTCDLNGSVPCVEHDEMTAFRDLIVNYTADFLGTGHSSSAQYIVDNLVTWAQENALLDIAGITIGLPGQADFRPRYELNWLMMPILQSWSIVLQADQVSPTQKSIVEAWLEKIVTFSAIVPGGEGHHHYFNVGYFELAVTAAWGAITEDDTLFQMGIERIYYGLHQMSGDGSFPREVARGATALSYQNVAMQSLFYLADLAIAQGYEPYSWSPPNSNKTLHDAVTFVIRSVNDISVIEKYAYEYPYEPSGPVEVLTTTTVDTSGRVSAYAHGKIQSAWLSSYIRRFPDHPNTPKLRAMLSLGLEQSRPLYHPQSGGNTTCMHASPFATGSLIWIDGFE